jgi:hypothetical protein
MMKKIEILYLSLNYHNNSISTNDKMRTQRKQTVRQPTAPRRSERLQQLKANKQGQQGQQETQQEQGQEQQQGMQHTPRQQSVSIQFVRRIIGG